MTTLVEQLLLCANATGVHVDVAPEVYLSTRTLFPVVRFPDIGGPLGMLVFEDFSDVRDVADAIVSLGYSYAILEAEPDGQASDLESFKEMIRDWGWAGVNERKPSWIDQL